MIKNSAVLFNGFFITYFEFRILNKSTKLLNNHNVFEKWLYQKDKESGDSIIFNQMKFSILGIE